MPPSLPLLLMAAAAAAAGGLIPRGGARAADALSPLGRVEDAAGIGSTSGISTGGGWQFGKALAECNRYMLDSQLATDVTFQVGPLEGPRSQIRAHRYVLVSRSAVFESMFYPRNRSALQAAVAVSTVAAGAAAGTAPAAGGAAGAAAAGSPVAGGSNGSSPGSVEMPGERVISITDIDPGVFRELLNFIYTDTATLDPRTVLPLMHAAKKYALPKLITACQRVLQSNLSTDNVCAILDQAIYFEEAELINKTVQFIGQHATAVIRSTGFLGLSRTALHEIVAYDWLRVNESELYTACIKWAEHQLKKALVEHPTQHAIRAELGDVLFRIRFPTMPLHQFAALTAAEVRDDRVQISLLSCAEQTSVYYYIATRDHRNESLAFDWRPRYHEQSVDRFDSVIRNQWGCNGQADSIQFTVDKDVILTGIGTFASSHQEVFDVSVDVSYNPNGRDQIQTHYNRFNGRLPAVANRIGGEASHRINATGLQQNDVVKVHFDQSVKIEAGKYYTIGLRQVNGGNGCYRVYGQTPFSSQREVAKEGVKFTFNDIQGSQTTVQQGQIPRLFYILT